MQQDEHAQADPGGNPHRSREDRAPRHRARTAREFARRGHQGAVEIFFHVKVKFIVVLRQRSFMLIPKYRVGEPTHHQEEASSFPSRSVGKSRSRSRTPILGTREQNWIVCASLEKVTLLVVQRYLTGLPNVMKPISARRHFRTLRTFFYWGAVRNVRGWSILPEACHTQDPINMRRNVGWLYVACTTELTEDQRDAQRHV